MEAEKKGLLSRVARTREAVEERSRQLSAARAELDGVMLEAVEAGATWVEVGSAAGATPNTVSRALSRARGRLAGGGA